MGKAESVPTIGARDLERVLRFFREAGEAEIIASDEQTILENRQQDILHEFEFVNLTHNERGHLGKELTEVRRRRRAAKNTCELLKPLCDWIANNGNAIKALQKVLGEMRHAEERQKNRLYRKKADGKGEVVVGEAQSERRKKNGA